jgi:hypothetical protein
LPGSSEWQTWHLRKTSLPAAASPLVTAVDVAGDVTCDVIWVAGGAAGVDAGGFGVPFVGAVFAAE